VEAAVRVGQDGGFAVRDGLGFGFEGGLPGGGGSGVLGGFGGAAEFSKACNSCCALSWARWRRPCCFWS